jgi:predicted ATP-grasp superfamily ATP-dependent carboligase
VYEHITGGGCLDGPLPRALLAEASLMVRALLRDLAAVPGIELVTLRDWRLPPPSLPVECRLARDPAQWSAAFEEAVCSTDATWPIAPETGGVLLSLTERVLRAGRGLLGSRPDAVRVAASKHATACRLAAAGIATIPTFIGTAPADIAAAGWVAKPDDGCGCEDTYLFAALPGARAWVERQCAAGRFVLQPFVPGEAASLSILAAEGRAWLLSVNHQRIERRDAALRFTGTIVNAIADPDRRYQRLAERICAALPGLWGHFGVDLVLTDSGPVVVEINPRLTTSYAGLHDAIGVNPAALVLRLLNGDHCDLTDVAPGRPVAVDAGS